MIEFRPLIAPLFVPATRPDRIAKAAQSGADAIIIDLEDAVPAPEKAAARDGLAQWLSDVPVPVFVRINAVGTEWFLEDVSFVRRVKVSGVMLPKTETAADVAAVGQDMAVVGLVESAAGIASLIDTCKAETLCQLAFGSIDYALDVGCAEERDALLLARLSLVTQSRAHDLPSPLDGVTVSVSDEAVIRSDTDDAVKLGFGGKLVIHPKQVRIINQALRPSAEEIRWAKKICAAAEASDGAAILVDERMIDAPVIKRAKSILSRSSMP